MISLLINDEKTKDPKKGCSNFQQFLSIAENLNLHQVGKDYPISFLKVCNSFQIQWY
jgi:hypothetical protein